MSLFGFSGLRSQGTLERTAPELFCQFVDIDIGKWIDWSRRGFCKRYETEIPNIIAKFEDVTFEKTGDARFNIIGRIDSWLEDFDQDEIDAFVLTYRTFTQANDQISIASLACIYEDSWMPIEALECFADARKQLNDTLDTYAPLDFNDGPIRLRTLVDIVIYGGLAHTHERKTKIFESWESSGILNSIVVNDVTNAPGDHAVTRPGKKWKQEQAEVMKTDWHAIRCPTTGTLRQV